MVPKSILVAQSNAYLSDAIANVLSALGFEVATVRCGVEIPQRILEFEPDLLLIDYDLSRQVDLGAIRARFSKLKIVATGVYEPMDGVVEIGRKVGLDGFLCRYAPREELHRSVRTVLA